MFRRMLIVVTVLWVSFWGWAVEGVSTEDNTNLLIGLGVMLIPPAAIWWIFYGNEL